VSIALMAAGPLPHLAQPVETRALRGRMRRAKTDREDARWLHELLAEGGYRRSRSSPLTAPGELAPGAAARATRHPPDPGRSPRARVGRLGRRRLRHSINIFVLGVVRAGLTLAFDFAVSLVGRVVHWR
jgi:hypothetical protein